MHGEKCALCSVPAEQKCAGCKSVFYCCRDHQKRHWKEHSSKCVCYQLQKNEKLGRHYVASRNIEAGEVILKEEKPLVTGPLLGCSPICLNCYVVLTVNNAVPCEKCGWPLCTECKDHGAECDFTRKRKEVKISITNFDLPHPTYRCIGVVRALALRDVDPEAYKRILHLEGHCEKNDPAFDEQNGIAQFVKFFFKVDDVPEAEIAKIARILQINGHEVPTTEVPHMAVYDLASYLEHSCRANCSKSFTNDGGIIIRAAVPIRKGEHITICYTDPLWGVTNRRHHLLRTKFFECTCERCSDPTEFRTMFNGVMCTKGLCRGTMLPKSFLTLNGDFDYFCNKCQQGENSDRVDQLMEMIGRKLAEMKKGDVVACKSFIRQQSAVLHENHYYMIDVKLALAQMIGQQAGGLPVIDDELLSEKILLCKKINDLLRVLVPAENRVRGLILFEMHAAVAEFARRQGQDGIRGILMESRKLLAESYQLLRHEPEILPEGKIAVEARKNLRHMDTILKTLCQNAVTPM